MLMQVLQTVELTQLCPAGHAPVNSEAGTTPTEEVNIIAGQFNNKTTY